MKIMDDLKTRKEIEEEDRNKRRGDILSIIALGFFILVMGLISGLPGA